MRKKKNVFTINSKNKPNFKELFKKSLNAPTHYTSYDAYDEYDDDAYYAYWERFGDVCDTIVDSPSLDTETKQNLLEVFFPFATKKSKKVRKTIVDKEKREIAKAKKKARIEKQKKERIIDVESYDFSEDNLDNCTPLSIECALGGLDCGKKKIIFYPDYNDFDNTQTFNSLYEFDDFCESRGYEIDMNEANKLMARSVSHCCLDPKKEGFIVSENSAGNLWYYCVEDAESEAERFS